MPYMKLPTGTMKQYKQPRIVREILKLVMGDYWQNSRPDQYVLNYIDWALRDYSPLNEMEYE